MDIQREAAGALLDTIGRRVGTRWFVNREMLSTIARRAIRDPQKCVAWNPVVQFPEDHGTLRFGRALPDEFCKTFFRANQCLRLQDLTEVVYLFNAFCKHAFNWLLNLQRPLDLGFCIIYPCPYRIDWKQRFTGDVADPKLLEKDAETGRIHWGLEIEPTGVWDKHVQKMEEQRLIDKEGGYWQSVLDMIDRVSPYMTKIYERFKIQAARPHPEIPVERTAECLDPLPGGTVPTEDQGRGAIAALDLPRKRPKGRRKAVATAD